MTYLKIVVAFIMSLTQIVTPFFQFAIHGGIDSYFDDWSETDEFTADYAITLEKDPDKDFIVLNLADIQWATDDSFDEVADDAEALITKAVEETDPDLITLTGDNCSSALGYIKLAKFLDTFEIPWAPIMGNHDGSNGNVLMEGWDSYILSNSEYCLFKFGPEDMGYGNYIINITENGKIIHTLFMMDTHSDADDTDAGVINYGEDGSVGYDHLWANQIAWYKWGVQGVEKLAGGKVESTVFTHIPCREYVTARDLMCDANDYDGDGSIDEWTLKDEYADQGFGSLNENNCPPNGNNGFFDTVLELGSTKNIISGHDHTNNLCLNYKGVMLDYALKTGHGSYWMAEKQGTSTLTITSDGTATFAHNFAD